MEEYINDKELIQEVMSCFYLDDLPSGADSLQEAKHRVRILFEIFQDGCFPLKKWSTNSAALASYIREISRVENPSVSCGQDNVKFLGVPWSQISDELMVPTSKAIKELSTGTPSKRKLLRALAQVFDPLGILTPTTIQSKILFQKLWKDGLDWDDPLSGDTLERYKDFAENLKRAHQVTVPR